MYNFKQSITSIFIRTYCHSSSILINQELSTVYKKSESYPIFVKNYNIKRILENSEHRVSVEVGMKVLGLQFVWNGIGEKIKNTSIHYRQTVGLLRGMHAKWSFKKIDQGVTEVIINIEFKKLFLLGFFLKLLVRNITEHILSDLKTELENREEHV